MAEQKSDAELAREKLAASIAGSGISTEDARQAESKRTEAAVGTGTDGQRNEKMIAALRREREGLVLRGLDDRVAQVDEQLKLHGAVSDAAPTAAEARAEARRQPPKGRSSTPQQTTGD